MQPSELMDRIAAGEDERTEFKRSPGDLRAVGKALCGFANGAGGLLVLGVEDSRAVVGVAEDTDRVQERLTGFLHSGLGKPVSARCGYLELEGKTVHWVEVHRQQRRYEPFAYDGRYWIRRGRASVAPSPSELQELLNVFGLVLTEQQVVPSARIEHLDFDAIRSFRRRQGADTETEPQPARDDDLRAGGIADDFDGELRPTLYGLLFFGKDPQAYSHTRSLFVQCAAYDGADRAAEVLSAGEGKGRIEEQLQRAIGWFRSLGRREVYRGLRREDIPPVPEDALREALVNAVIHREYAITGSQVLLEVFSDRITVTSPGALPNHMTVERARSGGMPRSRNEAMAHAMVVLGFMERRGRGWLRMRHAMRRFNGTEPELWNDRDAGFVRVVFDTTPVPFALRESDSPTETGG